MAQCPKCGGEVWDNRERKAAGKMKATAPDMKCKDEECGWKQWPPKGQKGASAGSATARPQLSPAAKKAGRDFIKVQYIGLMEWVAAETGRITKLKGAPTATFADIQATTFSIFKLMSDKGYLPDPARDEPKPAPPPPPPPQQEEQPPEYDESDLPF